MWTSLPLKLETYLLSTLPTHQGQLGPFIKSWGGGRSDLALPPEPWLGEA